jgi:hypothetical protein
METQTKPRLVGINHVALEVGDVEACNLIDIADGGSCAFLRITDQERGGMRSTSRLDVA